jgi:preprotein translocase subunit SecA
MLKSVVTKVIGTRFDRELKRIQPIIDEIKDHETRLGRLSDAEIRAQTDKLRGIVRDRLGDLALMQHEPANQLYVVRHHVPRHLVTRHHNVRTD